MKRLRELRTMGNYTQEELAAMLRVSQQTIARWESGKAEPGIQALRDIAVIFGTSVDDLLEVEGATKSKITTNQYRGYARQGEDAFWGHLGIMFPGESKSRWYPVTSGEAERLTNVLSSSDNGWALVSTLNNRLLALNVAQLKRVSLVDDAEDQIADDWELGWDSYQGHSPEIYKGLEDRFFSSEEEFSNGYSETLRHAVEDLIETHRMTEETATNLLLETHIHFTDGTEKSLSVEPIDLAQIAFEVESELYGVFSFDEEGLGRSFHIPPSQIRLIDMPLLKEKDGAEKLFNEGQED